MSKSKRQVKKRMGTKKRRVVRRKTQKRKQTKRRGGEIFKRPPLPTEKTYRTLSTDAAIDPEGVLHNSRDTTTTLGDEGIYSEPPKRRLSMPSMPSLSLPSVSFYNPFSKPKQPASASIDPDVKEKMINNIERMIDAKKRTGKPTDELEKKLAELQPISKTMTQKQEGRATNFIGQYDK